MQPELGIRIPPEQLSAQALRGVIEEFVTRDGTDFVEGDIKHDQVLDLLRKERAAIWFDPQSGTCSIWTLDD